MQNLPAVRLSWELASRPSESAPKGTLEDIPPVIVAKQPKRGSTIVALLVVAGTTAFVISQLRPGLLFAPTLDVGGDNAAHVVSAYYLIHDLLPRGQLAGWDPQWFNGFPLYVFYFPLPALLVGFFSWFAPYAVAFKLVTVLGSVALPAGAYVFGRGAGFARPVPELMSVATVPFLFDTSFTIYGGNLPSTLAGEFSYSLAIACGMFFLGVFAYALRTGRLQWLAALLLGATVLCHVVPALFFGGLAVLFAASLHSRKALRALVLVGVVGGLLVAFWLVPFGAYLRYSTSMGYTRVAGTISQIFPLNGELALPILAAFGCVFAIIRRERFILALALSAIGIVGLFQFAPSGLVYNARWLPFWFLIVSLLAAYGLACIAQAFFVRLHLESFHRTFTPVFTAAVTLGLVASWLGVLPIGNWPVGKQNFIGSWVSWNYSGYQRKPGWTEYQRVVTMLDSVTKTYGCGRLDYEYSPNVQNAFGSTLVEMAFPLFTNGCIQSAEGLYYESSTSTPFHFLDQAELSIQASNPVVGLPYSSLNIADGIRHLQLQGIKYFLANSPRVEQAAAQDTSLVKVASTPASAAVVDGAGSSSANTAVDLAPTWTVYRIISSPLVTSLRYEPVVETGLSKTTWLTTAIEWYQKEQYWPVPIVTGGLSTWLRERPGALVLPQGAVRVNPTTVSNVQSSNESISFHVSRLGVPVLVKIPYFPNWQATGAKGPFDTTPNLMVVVPTSHEVSLHYGTTTIDVVGKFGTALGFLDVVALIWTDVNARRKGSPGETNDPTDDEPKTADNADDDLVED